MSSLNRRAFLAAACAPVVASLVPLSPQAFTPSEFVMIRGHELPLRRIHGVEHVVCLDAMPPDRLAKMLHSEAFKREFHRLLAQDVDRQFMRKAMQ